MICEYITSEGGKIMSTTQWFNNAVVYQIYPIGYCGVARTNTFSPAPATGEGKILRVIDHIPELKRLGFNAVMFNPLFESTAHGYDTVDFTTVDSRLGTNADFKAVCDALHENGIRIILDAVFNHVGRDFTYFKDVRENKHSSRYKDWFFIRDGNSNYNDGFFYEGWEGHYDLVKLNLFNPEVKNHIYQAVSKWVSEFNIDGLRLDVAYSLEHNFLRELRVHCKGLKSDFWLMGETLHGDYNTWLNPEMLDSVTNYECYKGLYSSFNELNMYEIAYSLGNRQFGQGGMYQGKKLYCFVDNHDVGRIASVLKDIRHSVGIHALLFTMPGIPGIYYGSEYGVTGGKREGDDALRPEFILGEYKDSALTAAIAKLAKAHAALKPLYAGDYRQVVLNNQYFAFARSCDGETVYTLINASGNTQCFHLGGASGANYKDVLSGESFDVSGNINVGAFGAMVLAIDNGHSIFTQDTGVIDSEPVKPIPPVMVEEKSVEPTREKPDSQLAELLINTYKNIKLIADKLNIPLD
jgi:glycosidase